MELWDKSSSDLAAPSSTAVIGGSATRKNVRAIMVCFVEEVFSSPMSDYSIVVKS